MKKILLFILLLLPLSANASWVKLATSTGSGMGLCTDKISDVISRSTAATVTDASGTFSPAWRIVSLECHQDASKPYDWFDGLNAVTQKWDSRDTSTIDDITNVYGAVFTDEQCRSMPVMTAGIVSSDGGTTASYHGCVYKASGVAACSNVDGVCYADWTPAGSTGQSVEYFDSEQTADSDVPDYLTPTDDPSSCSGGSMSAGGQSYCVDTSQISNPSSFPSPSTDTGGSDDGSTGSDGVTVGGDTGSDSDNDGTTSGSSGGSSGGSGGGSGSTGDGTSTGDTGSAGGDSGADSGSDSGSDSSGSTEGDGTGDGSDDVSGPDGYTSSKTIGEVVQGFYDRVAAAPIAKPLDFGSAGADTSCPTAQIDFSLGFMSVNQTLDFHCKFLDEWSGILQTLFLFIWGWVAYRVFMAA